MQERILGGGAADVENRMGLSPTGARPKETPDQRVDEVGVVGGRSEPDDRDARQPDHDRGLDPFAPEADGLPLAGAGGVGVRRDAQQFLAAFDRRRLGAERCAQKVSKEDDLQDAPRCRVPLRAEISGMKGDLPDDLRRVLFSAAEEKREPALGEHLEGIRAVRGDACRGHPLGPGVGERVDESPAIHRGHHETDRGVEDKLDRGPRAAENAKVAPVSIFLMDPIEGIDIEADSTFVLMLEAERRGHGLVYAHPRTLELRQGAPFVTGRRVSVRREAGNHHTLGAREELALNDADVVFMRKDPPFDADFLVYTWILDRIDRARVVCVNDPAGIRDYNEKISALHFPELLPPTLISADRDHLRGFIDEHGEIVVKPLLNAGGAGVLFLRRGDRNIGSVLDLLTEEGTILIEAQMYLSAVREGDKRVILLDGQPIGAVNRVPTATDIRANMHVGGKAQRSVLNDRDREICARIAPELSERGLVFVGIDIIGGYLTEINLTSPTGLQEINRYDGVSLEAQILDWVEHRRAALRK